MPTPVTPIKPSSHNDWTVSNPSFGLVTIEPTTGKKTTGWTPGEAPAIQFMNWLFFNTDQWIKYFESMTDAQTTLINTLQNSLFSTNMVQEVLLGTADGSNPNFTLTQAPSAPTNTFVFLDSTIVPRTEYTLTGRNIVFNADTIPSAGTTVQAMYIIQTGFSGQTLSAGAAGSVPKVQNLTVAIADVLTGQISLALAPFDPSSTVVDIIGEGAQLYGTDFTVTGNILSWSGRGMASVISAGDVLRIQYFV